MAPLFIIHGFIPYGYSNSADNRIIAFRDLAKAKSYCATYPNRAFYSRINEYPRMSVGYSVMTSARFGHHDTKCPCNRRCIDETKEEADALRAQCMCKLDAQVVTVHIVDDIAA